MATSGSLSDASASTTGAASLASSYSLSSEESSSRSNSDSSSSSLSLTMKLRLVATLLGPAFAFPEPTRVRFLGGPVSRSDSISKARPLPFLLEEAGLTGSKSSSSDSSNPVSSASDSLSSSSTSSSTALETALPLPLERVGTEGPRVSRSAASMSLKLVAGVSNPTAGEAEPRLLVSGVVEWSEGSDC